MRDRDTRPDHKEVPMSLFKNAEPKAPEIIKNPEETPVIEPWNEARGLELYRTMRAYRQNRQEDLLEDTKAFFTPWLQAGLPGKSIPNTLPMLALTFLYEELCITDKEEAITRMRAKLASFQRSGNADDPSTDKLFKAITKAQKELVALKKAHRPLQS